MLKYLIWLMENFSDQLDGGDVYIELDQINPYTTTLRIFDIETEKMEHYTLSNFTDLHDIRNLPRWFNSNLY
jgi:hypothetical protein